MNDSPPGQHSFGGFNIFPSTSSSSVPTFIWKLLNTYILRILLSPIYKRSITHQVLCFASMLIILPTLWLFLSYLLVLRNIIVVFLNVHKYSYFKNIIATAMVKTYNYNKKKNMRHFFIIFIITYNSVRKHVSGTKNISLLCLLNTFEVFIKGWSLVINFNPQCFV